MIKFNEIRRNLDPDQIRQAWKFLLDENRPANLYHAQMVLLDANGDHYCTTNPLFVIRPGEGYVDSIFCTKTRSFRNLLIVGYKLFCEDVFDWFPPRYKTIKGGGCDGEDATIKLSHWGSITGAALNCTAKILEGDELKITAKVRMYGE